MSARLAPEVVQTSTMDCGPAALKSILGAFGVDAHYGRLREACQAGVDGTSIDMLEVVLNSAGVAASQRIVPVEHLAFPASRAQHGVLVVEAAGATHFVVVWGHLGGRLQVMDPRSGRRFVRPADLLPDVYRHEQRVRAEQWLAWARAPTFLQPLAMRLHDLGVSRAEAAVLVDTAARSTWLELAGLDAAVRFLGSLVTLRLCRPGAEAREALARLRAELASAPDPLMVVQPPHWSARPIPGTSDVLVRGAVVLQVDPAARVRPPTANVQADVATNANANTNSQAPGIAAALRQTSPRPLREAARMLRTTGTLALCGVGALATVQAGAVVVEALALKSLFDVTGLLAGPLQRSVALLAFVSLLFALVAIDLPMQLLLRAIGRRVETEARVRFLTRLPLLAPHAIDSRPRGDTIDRAHALSALRRLPHIVVLPFLGLLRLLIASAVLLWVVPRAWPLLVAGIVVSTAGPLLQNRVLRDRAMRAQTHAGALLRFYLDALQGLVPLRAHSAERALSREHEAHQTETLRAQHALLHADVAVDTARSVLLGAATSGIVFVAALASSHGPVVALLITWWVTQVTSAGTALSTGLAGWVNVRTALVRWLETLDEEAADAPEAAATTTPATTAVHVAVRGVSLVVGGHPVLRAVDLTLAPGEHVAVVGRSGAGKSSLVSLLLGMQVPATGEVLVDGVELAGQHLRAIRRATAWIDPDVQLKNRSVLDNLRLGNEPAGAAPLAELLGAAELDDVIARLPDGLGTVVGEAGARLSGGQGQRVRLGRGLWRRGVRLALLDEPFRGLDRPARTRLLGRVRSEFREATLVCVTHDIQDARAFSRVIVVDNGAIVEDGAPDVLLRRAGSRFGALLEADGLAREAWRHEGWRRLLLDDGTLREEAA